MTITAKVVLDSISEEGVRLTTMELTYPRFIHHGFQTHRVFSRNAASLQEIPVEKMIDRIIKDPAIPVHWGKNQPGGMQADEELPWDALIQASATWHKARDAAVKYARDMHALGAHKQIVNRILEPFSHITVLVTATEWENFYKLRRHRYAQPEIHALANAMFDAQYSSTPRKLMHGEWHLPYVYDDDLDEIIKMALHQTQDTMFGQATLDDVERATTRIACRVSTARCARVSYLTHDGQKPDIAKDDQLFHRLMIAQPMHASPAEHQATPDRIVRYGAVSAIGWENPQFHGNLVGWQQHRKFFLGENTPSNQLTKHGVLTSATVNKIVSMTNRSDNLTTPVS